MGMHSLVARSIGEMPHLSCDGFAFHHKASVPIRKFRHAWISRLTNFRIDEDTSKALFSSVVCDSEARYGDDPQYFGTTTLDHFRPAPPGRE